MKTEARPQHPLTEETVREAAREAVIALELDAEVKSVSAEKGRWCIQFTADYGQFSDTFVDPFGKENSFELIREKVKRHILKQQQNKIKSGVRIRRGQQQRRPESDSLFETAVQAIETITSQAAEVTGAIINQAAQLPAQALTALTATDASVSRTPEPPVNVEPTSQPLARITVSAAGGDEPKPARTSSKPQASSTSKRKASAKTPTAAAKKRRPVSAAKRPASAAKKSRAVSKAKPKAATKKKATKKKKSAARKSTPRPAQKRGATKRGAKGKK